MLKKFEEMIVRENAVFFVKGTFQDIRACPAPSNLWDSKKIYILAYTEAEPDKEEMYPIEGTKQGDLNA